MGNFHFKMVGLFIVIGSFTAPLTAQRLHRNINEVYTGELGIGVGAANYYGDLNPKARMNAVKMSAGIFYRRFFGQYFGASAHVDYARLGFSDIYNSDTYRHTRNLSFNTNVWSFSLQGDFNFFKFKPGSREYRFTPYISLGIGIFHYNPFAYYQGEKYYLQPLGTEGQGSSNYPDREKYGLWSWEIPMELGVKYNLNESWNVFLSASYRLTGTDYLDDVSKTYAGAAAFNPTGTTTEQAAYHLQDRSGVYGVPIGKKGRARGNSTNKDQYMLLQVGISYLFTRYRCP